ncbi:MAG TPA: CDP-alcohol phosphatidyltransferase family protein, partial [Thermoanaerobaculia bacterium]|nr:CDP-alcohol phosphatidyltransferase family protein [Thermoanaerobaculia bacterium]
RRRGHLLPGVRSGVCSFVATKLQTTDLTPYHARVHVWRERLGRWLTPVARRCPLSPNAITVIALLLNLAAAALLYFRVVWIAIVIVAIAGLCDAFDGVVARVQDRATRFGDFLDHVADRIGDSALAAGWMLGAGVRSELAIAAIIVVMLNGDIGTQIEATYGQRNYESVGRGEFVLALIAFPILTSLFPIANWLTAILIVFAAVGIVQRLALASRLEEPR